MKIAAFIKQHKMFMNGLLFLTVALLTGYTIFHENNIADLIISVHNVSLPWLFLCAMAPLIFIGTESLILWILLKEKDNKTSMVRCLKYSLVGYFYSGITPSATGGQPFQIYYMKKDGNSTAKSTVALLSLALFYKLIMVFIGAALLLFWSDEIILFFGGYVWVYYLGFLLNSLVLFVILALMLMPQKSKVLIDKSLQIMIKLKLVKENSFHRERIESFMEGYKNSVEYLFRNRWKMGILIILTLIQRTSLLFIPVFIYMGLPLKDTNLFTILCIQAAIYVAVDLFPIPGAQGITELIYRSSYGTIFTANYLTASMIITRSASFYIIFVTGLVVVLFQSKLIRKGERVGR